MALDFSPAVAALASKLKTATGQERGLTYWALVKGEARELKAAKVRGRFERLATSALDLGAVHIELRATDGGVLSVVVLDDVEEPEDEQEAAAPRREVVHAVNPGVSSDAEAVRAMVKIVIEAQDKAISRQSEMMQNVMLSALNVMKVASERTSVLERALLASLTARERELQQGFVMLAEQSADVAAARQEQEASAAEASEASDSADSMAKQLMSDVVVPALAAKAMKKAVGGT